MQEIVERIERELALPGLVRTLAERLAPTDLQSLLLEVARRGAARRTPADVLSDFRRDEFVRPAATDARRLLAWEQLAFDRLPEDIELLELSPVCPLGTASVLAGVDQNWAVATNRTSEVVSDLTNVLALEAALRRREILRRDKKSGEPVHLAASHRLLRGQRFHGPGQTQHFALLGMVTAGRDSGEFRFELEALSRHTRLYLDLLREFLGPEVPLRLRLTALGDVDRSGLLDAQILAPIRDSGTTVECEIDLSSESGQGYYTSLRLQIEAKTDDGWASLVDGGVVDWTATLLSNAKERLFISGVGSERVCGLVGE